jgi:hypothetical protein
VHKRLQVWQEAGFFDVLFKEVKQLKKQLNQDIHLMDATIKSAKKGGLLLAGRVKSKAVKCLLCHHNWARNSLVE